MNKLWESNEQPSAYSSYEFLIFKCTFQLQWKHKIILVLGVQQSD